MKHRPIYIMPKHDRSSRNKLVQKMPANEHKVSCLSLILISCSTVDTVLASSGVLFLLNFAMLTKPVEF